MLSCLKRHASNMLIKTNSYVYRKYFHTLKISACNQLISNRPKWLWFMKLFLLEYLFFFYSACMYLGVCFFLFLVAFLMIVALSSQTQFMSSSVYNSYTSFFSVRSIQNIVWMCLKIIKNQTVKWPLQCSYG